jgi:hypothetical protein
MYTGAVTVSVLSVGGPVCGFNAAGLALLLQQRGNATARARAVANQGEFSHEFSACCHHALLPLLCIMIYLE